MIGKRQKKVIYYEDFVSINIENLLTKSKKIILYTKNDIYKIDSNKIGNYEELTSFINKYIEVKINITEERNIAFNKYYDPTKTIRLQASWLNTLVILFISSFSYIVLFNILDGSLLKESLGLFIFATIFMSICSLLPSGWLLFGNRYKIDLEKLKIYSLLKVKEVIYFKDIISCGGNESELYFYTKDKKYNKRMGKIS